MASYTIMVIDDIPDHRDVLRRVLQAVGYQVIESTSGAEALQHARQSQPDLILSAISLPGQPAWESARQLHAQPDLAHMPILATTMYRTLLSTTRLQTLGCVDCIEKPFDLDMLLQRILLLLHDHQSERPA